MHSTNSRAQIRLRSSRMPCMRFPLRLPQQLWRRLQYVLFSWRWELQQRWKVKRRRRPFKATLVTCQFVGFIHANSDCVAHTGPRGC